MRTNVPIKSVKTLVGAFNKEEALDVEAAILNIVKTTATFRWQLCHCGGQAGSAGSVAQSCTSLTLAGDLLRCTAPARHNNDNTGVSVSQQATSSVQKWHCVRLLVSQLSALSQYHQLAS